MFKRFVLCLLVPFLFSSCGESVYLDMSGVHCELDKITASYQKDENITLSYYGSFGDSSDTGSVGMYFCVYKIIEGERESLQKITFESDKVSAYHGYDGEYYVDIKKNEKLTEFYDSIILSISKAGNYELLIGIDGYSEKHPYGGLKDFTFPIRITE